MPAMKPDNIQHLLAQFGVTTDDLVRLLGHAVKKADAWHDYGYGGPIEDDILIEEARRVLSLVAQWKAT